jgi:hypothetical protein
MPSWATAARDVPLQPPLPSRPLPVGSVATAAPEPLSPAARPSSRQQPRYEPSQAPRRSTTTSTPAREQPHQRRHHLISSARHDLHPAPRPPRYDLPTRDPQLATTCSVRDTTREPPPLWLDTATTSGRRGILVSFRGGPRGATPATRDHLRTRQDLTLPTTRTSLLDTTAEAGPARTTRPPTPASSNTGEASTPLARDNPTPRPQHHRDHLTRVLDLATTSATRHALLQPPQAQRGATTSSLAPLRQPAHLIPPFAQLSIRLHHTPPFPQRGCRQLTVIPAAIVVCAKSRYPVSPKPAITGKRLQSLPSRRKSSRRSGRACSSPAW